MSDVIKLGKCDMDKPFVFVSYSKKDKDYVYPLINELEGMGYNIWIDSELRTMVGKDWQKGALKAIANPNCKALLFMVSRNSLTSAPVYAELMWSQNSQKVKNMHGNKPIALITINVDDSWSPSRIGIEQWIVEDIGVNNESLVPADYDSLKNIDCINHGYYEEDGINQLTYKGEIAFVIYNDVLKTLGGSKITFASYKETDTICINLPESTKINDTTDIVKKVEKSKTIHEVPKVEKTKVVQDKAVEISKAEKKSASVTGDLTYELFGKTYCENQSDMMLRVFAQILKRHEYLVPEICDYTGMNCLSKIDYTLEENRNSDMPSYFRVCRNFIFSTGNVCVGTAYAFGDKLKKIARLFEICGENIDNLKSEQIQLPIPKRKKNQEKEDKEVPVKKSGKAKKTADDFMA